MAGHHLPLLASLLSASLLALATAHPSATSRGSTADKEVEVVVQGMVYCQSCAMAGTWSLAGAKPLPSAKVSVACRDHKNRVGLYASFQTDRNGYFYAPLKGLELKGSPAEQALHACNVRLLSSADPKCNLLTNVNYGITGAPLREPNKTASSAGTSNYREVVRYSAGPLAFRSAYCPLEPHQ